MRTNRSQGIVRRSKDGEPRESARLSGFQDRMSGPREEGSDSQLVAPAAPVAGQAAGTAVLNASGSKSLKNVLEIPDAIRRGMECLACSRDGCGPQCRQDACVP